MFRSSAQVIRCCLAFLILLCTAYGASAEEISLSVPAEVKVGGEINVTWTGAGDDRDFISLDPVGAPESKYGDYKYARGHEITLMAPGSPGKWEVRYHRSGSGYPVAASATVTVVPDSATVEVPPRVGIGEAMEVRWQGPNNPQDFISIDSVGAPDNKYGAYKYTRVGSPVTMKAPAEAGKYEVRYHLGVKGYAVLGSASLEVGGATATLDAPAHAGAGETIRVGWTGPGNEGDFISIDPVDAPDQTYGPYKYTRTGNPVEIIVPDEVGSYEIRYHLGSGKYPVLGSSTIRVGAVTASISVTDKVIAGEPFEVRWQGPDHQGDFVTIVPVGTAEGEYGPYAYTKRGNPVRVRAPKEVGAHEVRYLTGQSYKKLAAVPVEVHPSSAKGSLRVTAPASAVGGTSGVGAVEVILDASGSMLKKLGGTRRIELARRALIQLVEETLPAGLPFALRVFGHREADSCRTDLEMPLAPLHPAGTVAKIRSIQAKNLAKTPIADSLSQVASDLAGASGPRLVILVTDGEETCGGDPEQAIRDLAAAGIDARVSIVGFAIDELMLKESFEAWAHLGGGRYFDATDGELLTSAMQQAIQPTFEVVAGSEVVATGTVGGEAVELPVGSYQIRLSGAGDLGSVDVVAGEEAVLESP